MTFARFLQEHRMAAGMTCKQLAWASGVSRWRVGAYEQGAGRPTRTSCKKLAQALGLPSRKVIAAAGHTVKKHVNPDDDKCYRCPDFNYCHEREPLGLALRCETPTDAQRVLEDRLCSR